MKYSLQNINRSFCYLSLGVLMTGLLSCKATKTLDMPAKMDNMNKEMQKTTSAIHDQTLLLALQEMEKDENFRDKNIQYFARPLDLLPGAEVFADEVTAEEMAKLSYLYLKIAYETVPNEDLKMPPTLTKTGLELNPGDMVQSSTPSNSINLSLNNYPLDYARRFDFEKYKKISVVQTIAGFLPQKIVEQMIKEQIEGDGGIYEEGVRGMLYLRAKFVEEILLKDRILSKGIRNMTMLTEALKNVEEIEFIYNHKFKDYFRFKVDNMINTDYNQEFYFDSNPVPLLYDTLLTNIEFNLRAEFKNDKRTKAIKNKVKRKIIYYSK